MRAAIYNPYLDTLGGGERYTMTLAWILAKNGWEVEVAWKNPKILSWMQIRLGIDLTGVKVAPDINRGAGYDLVFWLSDGSIPTLFGKKNILHFQTPFHDVDGKALFNRLKFAKIHKFVCNSKFTKKFIDAEYAVSSVVIYPPVQVSRLESGKKENTILSVGRFSQLQQDKRQDLLVREFKDLCLEGLSGWKLVLAGGSDVGRTGFVEELKREAQGFPITILENLPFDEIKKLYATSSIFWSAAGFGVDEEKDPERVEHFGITAVEAMSASCVPVLYNVGGHKEIVKSGEDGILWKDLAQFKEETLDLIKNERRRKELGDKAKRSAEKFSEERFEKEILELIG